MCFSHLSCSPSTCHVLTSYTHIYLYHTYTQKERCENAVAIAAANKAAEKKEKDAAKKARKEKAKAEAVSVCV